MYTLSIDTTAAACSIALHQDEKCIDCFEQSMDFGQAEVLMPEIDNILKKHNLTIKDLSLLVVCVGPGSFTGVRSSISAARAFGIACPSLEVMGISSFEGYVQSLIWQPEQISQVNAVIIETKREDFYFQLFDNKLKAIAQPSVGFRDDIISMLQNQKVTFIGDGVERFLSSPTGLSIHAILNSKHLDVKDIASSGIKLYHKKEHKYPKPMYLRAPDVCVKS